MRSSPARRERFLPKTPPPAPAACPQCRAPAGRPDDGGLTLAMMLSALGTAVLVLLPRVGLAFGPVLMVGGLAVAGHAPSAGRCPGCGFCFPALGGRWVSLALLASLTAVSVLHAFVARFSGG